YEPDAYFERMENLFIKGNLDLGQGRVRWWKKHRVRQFATEAVWFVQSVGFFVRLMTSVPDPKLRKEYRKRLWTYVKCKKNPGMTLVDLLIIAMHSHALSLAGSLRETTSRTRTGQGNGNANGSGATEREPILINSF